MPILSIPKYAPKVHDSVYIAPNAYVVGNVEMGEGCSVWFGSVVRGDVFPIKIGSRTNVQDLSTLHVTKDRFALTIGDDVTIGHNVTLHGCTVESRVLIGIGAILLDGSYVESDCMVAAGTLVPPGMRVPSGALVMGSPAKVKRNLTKEEIAFILQSSRNYVEYQSMYK